MGDDGAVSTPADHVWAEVLDVPLSLDAALAVVRDPRAGAVVVFVGTVRDHDGGRGGVTSLRYSAHPGAEQLLREVAERVAAGPGVCGVVAIHRSGELQVGEPAVVCVVSAEHRGTAFDGARRLIDELKEQVPIWKQQSFAEGDREWVGL